MRALQTSQIILRADYLKLVELLDSAVDKIDAGRKKVRFCAAKLLEYFRYWCSWVRQHEQREWYYRKLKQIYDDLMGEHSLHVIRAAIALLEKKEMLKRENNPNGQDKVYRYQVNNELLERLLQRGQGLEYAQPSTDCAEEGEIVGEDIKVGRILSPNALKENLQESDRNLQNSGAESQPRNQNNKSNSSNLSNSESNAFGEKDSPSLITPSSNPTTQQIDREAWAVFKPSPRETKTEAPEPTPDSCVSNKAKSDIPPKAKVIREDKSSAAVEPWEIAPQQPYPYFLQWRALHYKNQGGHWANSPQSNAYAEFYKNRFKTNILWQEFLQFYNLALDNALALQSAGIEVKLPTCFEDRDVVSEQEVVRKAERLIKRAGHPPVTTSTLAQNTAEPKRAIEPCADFSSRMSQLVKQRTLPKGKPSKQQPCDRTAMYLSWLHGDEPVLVEEAKKRLTRMVMERDDLEADWDEEGKLMNVTFLG